MCGRGRLHVHRHARGQGHGAFDLVGPAAWNHLQMDVAAKGVALAQKLGRPQHAIHGCHRTATNGRRKKQPEHASAAMELHECGGQLVGPETHRLTAAATAFDTINTRAFATCCLQHLQHRHALARGQRRRIDPQSAVATLAMLGRTASAGQVVLRGPRERRKRGLDRGSRPDEWHGFLILNIRPVIKLSSAMV